MTEERLKQVIGTLLRAGVSLSAAVVAAGGLWLLAATGRGPANDHQFRDMPRELTSVNALFAALTHPTPQVVVQFGLVLLIATPIARVILSLVAFTVERDRIYVVITSIVMCILLYSLATAG